MDDRLDPFLALGEAVGAANAQTLRHDPTAREGLQEARRQVLSAVIDGGENAEFAAFSRLGAVVAAHHEDVLEKERFLAHARHSLLARRGRAQRWWRPAAVGASATAMCAVAFLFAVPLPFSQSTGASPLSASRAAEALAAGSWLAGGDEEAPIAFNDGSSVTLRQQAQVRLGELRPQGADVELISGRIAVHVVPRDGNLWNVRAGPYTVVVLGTRFEVDWRAKEGVLRVDLARGKVKVMGPGLAGHLLTAGNVLEVSLQPQRLSVQPRAAVGVSAALRQPRAASKPRAVAEAAAEGEPVTTTGSEAVGAGAALPAVGAGAALQPVGTGTAAKAAVDPAPAEAIAKPADDRVGTRDKAPAAAVAIDRKRPERRRRKWRKARESGPVEGAAGPSVARRTRRGAAAQPSSPPATKPSATRPLATNLPATEPTAAAPELSPAARLQNADALRLSHRWSEASQLYRRLAQGSGHPAALATFSMGRVELSRGRPTAAVTWFNRYLERFPNGSLRQDARGRIIDAWERAGQQRQLCDAARSYLRAHPNGVREAHARRVVKGCGGSE